MKKLMLKDGSVVEAEEDYALRLYEQGEATGFVQEEAEKEAPKAEKEAEPTTKETPKKKGK